MYMYTFLNQELCNMWSHKRFEIAKVYNGCHVKSRQNGKQRLKKTNKAYILGFSTYFA
jgi:hypothetical protein